MTVSLLNPARTLESAPRVTASPENAAAVALALAHARARLSLPTFEIVWCWHPGGWDGQTIFFADGAIEVRLNAAADMAPRLVAWTALHEFKHVADGSRVSYEAGERAANQFAFDVTERESEEDFLRLSWRRPSGRRWGAL